jgi:hypothetical protein
VTHAQGLKDAGLSKTDITTTMARKPPSLTSPVLAGLRCGHDRCGALFSDFEDCEQHACELHDGVVLGNTCAVREMEDVSGKKVLVLVLDDGQWHLP